MDDNEKVMTPSGPMDPVWAERLGYADTGLLQRSYPRGSAADLVAAVEQVKPVGIRLVGIIVQGRAAPWWWRWVEPTALWLLKRAGFEVCR